MNLAGLKTSPYLINMAVGTHDVEFDMVPSVEDTSFGVELDGRRVARIYHFAEENGGVDDSIYIHYADGGSEVLPMDATFALVYVKYHKTTIAEF